MNDYDRLKDELEDLMGNVAVDTLNQYAAKNKELGSPLTVEQLALVSEVSSVVAANIALGFISILEQFESDPPTSPQGSGETAGVRGTVEKIRKVIQFPAPGSRPKQP